ncbi:hypothetical protein GCM10027037_25400 [Mucilaginibacter koreensis]
MKFLRLDLLTLLISLFILGSCKNTDTVGLPVNSEDQVTGTQLVSNDITVKTERVDSVLTTALAKTPLAYFKDPVLGTTEANVVSGVSLPLSSAYTKPTGTITTDSAVLVLRYADGFYGDSLNSNYRVNVYQLNELPLAKQVYYSNKSWSVGSAVIGGRAFKPYTHTKIKITDIVPGKADTLKTVPAQLRVPINAGFINNNFWNASTSQLANNPVFQAAIKGLYLKLDQGQSGVGGNIMFNLDSSRIDVYYRNVGATSTDTAIVSLPLANHSAEIKHTYSAAVNSAISSTSTNPVFYLQGLAGLKARIAFPTLTTLFGNVNANNIILNRAELVITPNPGSGVPFVPQPKLSMYRNDLAKQPTLLPDASSASKYFLSTGIFGGGYNSTLQSYRFVVTGYLQQLLRGQLTDYGTYITAVDTTATLQNSINYLPSAETAGRTIAVGTDKLSGYGIKLNIYYTKTNQ